MAERTLRLKFEGTPYVVLVDSRSFTLRRENKPNDKFPTPLGYHRSLKTMSDVLIKQHFVQVKGDMTVKEAVADIATLWDNELLPFLEACHQEQAALLREVYFAHEKVTELNKLVELVNSGKLQQAKTLARKLKG
ncbi:hypothetical protein ACRXCV_00325 (plasmid) [Halobacteriovorax sp. GFR7]|uniref:hypothetical protein n=1 Tax=unclassified Halobacteriovorax TaxID=2639665 RepID=UPI003D9893B9